MDLHLSHRTFLVTGASSGLGHAAAESLLAEGANVIAVARRAEKLETWSAERPEQLLARPGDLTDPRLPTEAVTAALERFGRLDGALISVGGPPRGDVLGNTDKDWREAFDAVFLSALRVARAVVSAATSPPVLAFVLSTSVRAPLATMAISNGLRPGLGMLIKQLADEIGPDGGRAIGLMPGFTDTDRVAQLFAAADDPAAARAAREQAIPLRRLGRPEEFGDVAAFLMSPRASYITGSMVAVDGGELRAL